jgi:hypothetical protein
MALMLDHPEKTARLLAALKTAVPFEVELAPSLIEYLQAENVADADRRRHVAWDFSRQPSSRAESGGRVAASRLPPGSQPANFLPAMASAPFAIFPVA